MRELVILSCSSVPNHHAHILPTAKLNSSHHHHAHQPKPASVLHSGRPVRHDFTAKNSSTVSSKSSLISHYSELVSNLALTGQLDELVSLLKFVTSSGINPSHFLSALRMEHISQGISSCILVGKFDAALRLLEAFQEMGSLQLDHLLNEFIMSSLKERCSQLLNAEDVDELVPILENLSGLGLSVKALAKSSEIVRICIEKQKPDLAVRYAAMTPNESILFCTVINEFGKKKDLESAFTAYELAKNNLTTPNMFLYRTIIDVCGVCGDHMKSRYIYEDLLQQNIIPNIYVINSLVNVNAQDLRYVLAVCKNIQNLGVKLDVTSYNILLKACSFVGRVDMAQEIYREAKQLESLGQLKLDVFTYSTIVKVFADAKLWHMALKVKEDMMLSGVTPNIHTWSSLISACANAGVVEQGIKLLHEMHVAGIKPSPRCCNILIHACVEASQYDRAFRIFNVWKEARDYTGDGDLEETDIESSDKLLIKRLTVASSTPNSYPFDIIREIPFKPTLTTFNTLMKACGGNYIRGRELMEEMKIQGLVPDHISWTILIDICGFSGHVDGAVQILKEMRKAGVEPDVVAYTNAIKVCVEAEKLNLAFTLFSEMKSFNVKPNMVTFNTLLKARTRYGSFAEIEQCLTIYQDMLKAGYKTNDSYLKQLIEEWCEGVLQGNDRSQFETYFSRRTQSERLHKLVQRVAAHLRKSATESLNVDLHGLSRVEARIVVLSVLRKIKENHNSGSHTVMTDMLITIGLDAKDGPSDAYESDVKEAIVKLLTKDLGLEVQMELARVVRLNDGTDTSPRRPPVHPRLKVTRRSINFWLQRNPLKQ